MKSVEVDVVNNFINDEMESSSDAKVYANNNYDDDDSEKDRVVAFK